MNLYFSNLELEQFEEMLLVKKNEALNRIEYLEDLINSSNEGAGDDTNAMQNSGSYFDVEFSSLQLNRQKKHLNDINNALLRIKNKSYGICSITGKLIDRARLLAVPTTTKSIEAKSKI